MNLVYYHPIAIANKYPFQKVINPLISVMDRTTNTWPPYNYINLFPMPVLKGHCPDFSTLSFDRAKDITENEKRIGVLWSGGIDSTFILTTMIESGVLEKLKSEGRLVIGLNQESIRENPVFYDIFIKKYFLDCVVQSDVLLQKPELVDIIITGEMADNLVGSLTMKTCVDYYNDFSVVHKPYGLAIDWLCRKLDESDKVLLTNFIEESISNSPVELISCHDLLWYLNFNYKWQAVNFRIVSHAADEANGNALINKLVHFFNTEEFQQWSMHEGHHFEGSNWSTYKMPLKQQIFNVTRDQDYFDKKTKYPSLPGLLRYKDTFDFIYYNTDNGGYHFTKKALH